MGEKYLKGGIQLAAPKKFKKGSVASALQEGPVQGPSSHRPLPPADVVKMPMKGIPKRSKAAMRQRVSE